MLTRRRFQNHFNVGRHGRVPKRDTIMKWVNNKTGGCTGKLIEMYGPRITLNECEKRWKSTLVVRRHVTRALYGCWTYQFAEFYTWTFIFIRIRLSRSLNLNTVWLQQDEATRSTSSAKMNFFKTAFFRTLCFIVWCYRVASSIILMLSTREYFLWSYRKTKVCINKSRTLKALSESLTRGIQRVPRTRLERSTDDFSIRPQELLDKKVDDT